MKTTKCNPEAFTGVVAFIVSVSKPTISAVGEKWKMSKLYCWSMSLLSCIGSALSYRKWRVRFQATHSRPWYYLDILLRWARVGWTTEQWTQDRRSARNKRRFKWWWNSQVAFDNHALPFQPCCDDNEFMWSVDWVCRLPTPMWLMVRLWGMFWHLTTLLLARPRLRLMLCKFDLGILSTYLFLLLVEVINNDSDEKVEREERAEDDEEDEVKVHVDVDFANRLLTELQG